MPTSSAWRWGPARASRLLPALSPCSTAAAAAPRTDAHGRIRARVSPDPLDLYHQGAERVIGSYLLETQDGPALFDCGASSCVERLLQAVSEPRLQLLHVRHLPVS